MTIKVKRGWDGHRSDAWLALLPDVGEWLPTPYFGSATFEQVAETLRQRNPGATVLEERG